MLTGTRVQGVPNVRVTMELTGSEWVNKIIGKRMSPDSVLFIFFVFLSALFSLQTNAQVFAPSAPNNGASLSGYTGITTAAMPAGAAGMSELCASAPDPLGCYRSAAAAANQGALTTSPGLEGQATVNTDASQPNPPVAYLQAEEPGEFEEFVAASIGKRLPVYGHKLFSGVPNSFSPLNNVPVTPDYLVGPGDEIVIRAWGQVDINFNAVVDRHGSITLPKVGSINVAGIRYSELQGYLKQAIGRVFRNFELNITLGKLRSIQVFVVGQAKRPGAYTVSSLSTLVNTLFASGGPSVTGSLRHIQVKRNGATLTELDMYEFLLKGDKSKDISLLPGDVIFIPPIGPLAAIAGSVNNPAIYELKKETDTLADLIEMAGGMSTTAEGEKVRVDRIDKRLMRQVEEFELNSSGLGRLLKDGDVVQVKAISGQFENAVTLRGNVANPGRFPWKEGMRVSDLIPNLDALVIPEYWAGQNNAHRVEASSETQLTSVLKRNINEINWDYAVVERLNKADMSTMLLPFNLGKAIGAKDPASNLLLQPGDLISIFSRSDINVPIENRSVYVRLEGEITGAGVYKVSQGETLRNLVKRVGGFTSNAYLFGAEFNRESVRVMQQKKMDEMLDKMEQSIRRKQIDKSAGALSADDAATSKAAADAQLALVDKMRKAKASGRVVLEIKPDNTGSIDEIPDIALEDGDRFIVPPRPDVVGVMGMVYNENAFMYKPGKQVSDYLDQSGGPTRDADKDRIYLVRADGSVVSSQNFDYLFFFNSFESQKMLPGDAIIVPELQDKFQLTRELKDWSQIFYQFALGVTSLRVLRGF
jgi:protein involved in polysaccharide export with SLBB domain